MCVCVCDCVWLCLWLCVTVCVWDCVWLCVCDCVCVCVWLCVCVAVSETCGLLLTNFKYNDHGGATLHCHSISTIQGGQSGNWVSNRKGQFSFLSAPRENLGSDYIPIHFVPTVLAPVVNQPWPKTFSPVMNAWSCISNLPCIFTSQCLIEISDNFYHRNIVNYRPHRNCIF